MKRNIIETVIGAVVLLGAVAFAVYAFRSSGVSDVAGYTVMAQFDDATGLSSGSEVRMAGVKIGSVTKQALDPETYLAELTLTIDQNVKLPTDTSARIVPEGLLGSNYVALEPGGEVDEIPAGGRIQHTQGAVNIIDLLGRFIFSAGEAKS